ncbi:hypothetical protein C8N46_101489 [Kordia periserrulae]|uniref:Lipocalin-like domain-containing protein n=1 Tax=Kordia periserrulae TaxID=701523 RepID=A0A2T6C6D2_9FLAO|nr:lipocalin family protein [Kordia periserrulae]PTX63880.1 hypothetical protein C8N46_101489 [Kordia periserrulae]
MKKLILLSVLSLGLFACSSDDDVTTVDPLVGTWRMTAFEVENAYDFNGDGTASNELISETNCYQNETIQINADGTALVTSNSFLFVVAELVAGTTNEFTYTLNCEMETDIFPSNWTVNGSNLSLIEDDGYTVTVTIDSDSQLSLLIPQGFQIYSGGFNAVAQEDVRVVYTKQ